MKSNKQLCNKCIANASIVNDAINKHIHSDELWNNSHEMLRMIQDQYIDELKRWDKKYNGSKFQFIQCPHSNLRYNIDIFFKGEHIINLLITFENNYDCDPSVKKNRIMLRYYDKTWKTLIDFIDHLSYYYVQGNPIPKNLYQMDYFDYLD